MPRHVTALQIPVAEHDHVLGLETASVTLVEFGDFQCPFCADAHPMLKRIAAVMGSHLRFVFRHMVMMEIHPFAQFAAEAAEAAHQQGKFWAMHDAIYEHQTELGTDLVDKLVDKLMLDRSRFDADLEARRGRARIRYDFMGGMRSGVAGTPTFFINGERYDGNVHERSLLAALQKQVPVSS